MKRARKPRVKICGVTRLADALGAARAGADYIGFNFYEGSPRYIPPQRARRIIARLPKRVKAVGVFVDAAPEHVVAVAAEVGLHVVQLHGAEPASEVTRLARSVAVWKAVRVRRGFRGAQLAKYSAADAILLDAFRSGVHGGTGATFDWGTARAAARYARIVLAGGLTAANVGEAIRVARPFAVDVASGVERAPGKKDAAKMRAFVQAAKRNVSARAKVKSAKQP